MRIGNIELKTPFVAAPLAGVSDAPTRSINAEMGASLVYSEMISAKGLMYDNQKTEELLHIRDDEGLVCYQIFGHEPEVMREVASRLADMENVAIDINMGCPVPKIVKNGEGSALMREPKLVQKIVAAVVRGTNGKKPVTVKMRAGFDDDTKNACEIAKVCEDAGAAAVTVHGRTREQMYSGKADWQVIKDVKAAVGIPVIGNGDVFSAKDALMMMEETRCDAVMIGRATLGNPWIFRECDAAWRGEQALGRPSTAEVFAMMRRHFEMLLAEKGEKRATLEMRKHACWYLKGRPHAAEFKRRINTITDASSMRDILDKDQVVFNVD